MYFVRGFIKTSAFDHNNQGQEFKMSDESGAYGAGPGGMGPSGLETYEGNKTLDATGKSLVKTPKKEMLKEVARRVAFGKMATIDGVPDSLQVGMEGTGSSGQGAETLASQLKYETSGDAKQGFPGASEEARIRRKNYLKAKVKGAKNNE